MSFQDYTKGDYLSISISEDPKIGKVWESGAVTKFAQFGANWCHCPEAPVQGKSIAKSVKNGKKCQFWVCVFNGMLLTDFQRVFVQILR